LHVYKDSILTVQMTRGDIFNTLLDQRGPLFPYV
jgi:hypothetical protein